MSARQVLIERFGEERFSEHFLVREFFVSDQTPMLAANQAVTWQQKQNMNYLASFVLERVREELNRAYSNYMSQILITSGLRDRLLNEKAGGAKYSRHTLGMAVDFKVPKMPHKLHRAYDYIKNRIPYGELILYQDSNGHPKWIHYALPVLGKEPYFDVKEV